MLTLRAADRARLVAHARALAPAECCGILVGEGGRGLVSEVVPAANVADERRTRYTVDPRTLVDVHRRCRRDGRCVVGYYHSHPASKAVPSERDRTDAWPAVSYVIVSLHAGVAVRSWRLAGDRFVEEPVVVVASLEDAA